MGLTSVEPQLHQGDVWEPAEIRQHLPSCGHLPTMAVSGQDVKEEKPSGSDELPMSEEKPVLQLVVPEQLVGVAMSTRSSGRVTKPTNQSPSERVRRRCAACQSEFPGGFDGREEVEACIAICQVCVAPASSVEPAFRIWSSKADSLTPAEPQPSRSGQSVTSTNLPRSAKALRRFGSGSMAPVVVAVTSRFTSQPSRSTSLRPAGGRGKAPASSLFRPRRRGPCRSQSVEQVRHRPALELDVKGHWTTVAPFTNFYRRR